MNKKTKIILGITIPVLALGAIAGSVYAVFERNKDAKSPLMWCIECIKEKDLFEENHVSSYAFTYEKFSTNTYTFSNDFNNCYYVNLIYDTHQVILKEEWICGIEYENTVWQYLKKEQIIEIGCELLTRKEI